MTTLRINNATVEVEDGTTVAAAILLSEVRTFRTSVTGEPRGPLCGMGVCFDCRVAIDGAPHQRSCTTVVRDGMEVVTGE